MMTNLIPMNDSESFTENELQMFEEKYLPVIQEYSSIVKQKKAFEEQEKKFKKKLGEVMDDLGIKTMDCPFARFTRVAQGEDKTSIDIDELQTKEPELYEELLADYPKVTKGRASYVKFDVK